MRLLEARAVSLQSQGDPLLVRTAPWRLRWQRCDQHQRILPLLDGDALNAGVNRLDLVLERQGGGLAEWLNDPPINTDAHQIDNPTKSSIDEPRNQKNPVSDWA